MFGVHVVEHKSLLCNAYTFKRMNKGECELLGRGVACFAQCNPGGFYSELHSCNTRQQKYVEILKFVVRFVLKMCFLSVSRFDFLDYFRRVKLHSNFVVVVVEYQRIYSKYEFFHVIKSLLSILSLFMCLLWKIGKRQCVCGCCTVIKAKRVVQCLVCHRIKFTSLYDTNDWNWRTENEEKKSLERDTQRLLCFTSHLPILTVHNWFR